MTATASQVPRMDLQWPRALNKILTNRWTHLKNTLVLKDFVDHLIQKRVVSLDYWMGLKSKPVTESERTEDFLSLVMKFNREKYSLFLEALLETGHLDLVKDLAVDADGKPKKIRPRVKSHHHSNHGEKHGNQTRGQTDADLGENTDPLVKNAECEKPQPKPRERITKVMEENKESSAANLTENANPNAKAQRSKAALEHQNKIVARLHEGIATIKPDEEGEDKDDQKDEKEKDEAEPHEQSPIPSSSQTGGTQQTNTNKSEVLETVYNSSRTVSDLKTDRKIGSAKSREEILEEREQNIINRETELNRKELELDKKDKSLQEMETNLIIRERSLVLEKQVNSGPASLPKDIQALTFGRPLNSPAASSTQSSDYLAEVRDQIRELRRVKGEIEDETSFGPTPKPKDDYVKIKDLEIVQQDIAEIKEGIATDRDGRENLQEKLEEQKNNIENLHSKIATLENEKEESEKDFNKKITKLKADLKNVKSSQNDNLNKVREEIKTKEEECKKLKSEMDELKKNAADLENRVSILETDKTWAEKELQRMEKEVADLKQRLNEKEGELSELRTILEDTETERDDLIDEVTQLKNEIGKLRSDKRKLEQEKKSLLQRCVKPSWNQNTRMSSFK